MPITRAGKLNNLPARLDAAIKRGLIEGGQVVAQRATRKAPRDTGRLKRSITAGSPKQVSRAAYRIDVGTNVEYAAAQEFGSGIHAESGPKTSSGLFFFLSVAGALAQPYLRPALNESRKIITDLLIKNIKAT